MRKPKPVEVVDVFTPRRLPDGVTVPFDGQKVDAAKTLEEPMQMGSAYYDAHPVLGVRVTR